MKTKTYPKQMLHDFIVSVGGAAKVRFEDSRCTFQFAIPAIKVAIEIESGSFGQKINWAKLNRAQLLGWKYLRFSDHEIRVGIAKEMVGKFIESRQSA
jgi:hypothetical protein